jgi:hypothetical protein
MPEDERGEDISVCRSVMGIVRIAFRAYIDCHVTAFFFTWGRLLQSGPDYRATLTNDSDRDAQTPKGTLAIFNPSQFRRMEITKYLAQAARPSGCGTWRLVGHQASLSKTILATLCLLQSLRMEITSCLYHLTRR